MAFNQTSEIHAFLLSPCRRGGGGGGGGGGGVTRHSRFATASAWSGLQPVASLVFGKLALVWLGKLGSEKEHP